MKPSPSTPNPDNSGMPVPCRFWAEKLAAGHPDDLSPVERMALESHLAHCPSCSAVRAEYEAIWQELRQLPASEPRPGLPPALLKLWQAQPETVMSSGNNGARELQTMPSWPLRRRRHANPLVQTLAVVLVIAAVLGTFLAIFTVYHSKLTTTGANSGTGWHIIKSPNPGKTDNGLNAVAIAASDDIWTVGHFSNSPPVYDNGSTTITSSSTLTEHWNGSKWNVVPAQNPGKALNDFSAVAALSTNDAWAVGSFSNSSNSEQQPLIEHWNGMQWSIVPGATKPGESASLVGISAISASNIWAVGSSYKSQALIEHWNGIRWNIVPTPDTGSTEGAELDALTVISANDIWAVGTIPNSTVWQTLIEHWNGSQWSIVQSPGSDRSALVAVAAVSGNDIWAVGSNTTGNMNDSLQQTLIEHWNGSQWSIVPGPNLSSDYDDYLSGIVVSANDVWTIGNSPQQPPQQGQMLLAHWDGKSWHSINGADLHQANNNILNGIARDAHSGALWAVGMNGSGIYDDSTLIETYP